MNEKETAAYGTLCLMARRLVERGVRFVEIYSGSGSRWDAHSDLHTNHTQNCKSADKPVAGLLADLKARGMLKDTLVVWGGEFGRTPFFQGTGDEKAGRDHNPWGFTMFMAGGGVKVDFSQGGVSLSDLERTLIAEALKAASGNRRRAAELLDISVETLRYRMEKYSLTGGDHEAR